MPARRVLVASLQIVAAAGLFVPASDPAFRFVGRFEGHSFDRQGCEIQFRTIAATEVAVSLAQRFPAPALAAHTDDGAGATVAALHQDFLVYIDGKPLATPIDGSLCTFCTFDTVVSKNETVHEYMFATALPRGSHEFRIVKVTEPMFNGRSPAPSWVTFHGVRLDLGAVAPPGWQRQRRRIEFIGDSITAGYCNLCKGPWPAHSGMAANDRDDEAKTHEDQESFALSWPTLICDRLDAECSTVAWSGLGLIRNCCGGDTFMPEIWNRTLATGPTGGWNSWDFSRWVPDALVVNLGTNDQFAAKTDAFVQSYVRLIGQASDLYGRDLQVFLACGPISAEYCVSVYKAIGAVAEQGVRAHFLDQRGFLDGKSGPDCCNHPGAQVDAAMALVGAESIAAVMGWDSYVV